MVSTVTRGVFWLKLAPSLAQNLTDGNHERRFQLADNVEVTGAVLENGLLHVDLVRELPEAMKPRKIAIGNGQTRQIDAAAA